MSRVSLPVPVVSFLFLYSASQSAPEDPAVDRHVLTLCPGLTARKGKQATSVFFSLGSYT